MIIELDRTASECIQIMKHNQEMDLTGEDKEMFYNSECCHISNKQFGEKGKTSKGS